MEDQELDFKTMFEELANKFDAYLKRQNEYFELFNFVSERSKQISIVGKNFLKMKLSDQIALLRIYKLQAEFSEKLYEKYKLDELEKEDESDEREND